MTPTELNSDLLVFLVAGEASGDALASRLMSSLQEQTGGAVRFAGVGGAKMAEQGLESLFPMEDLSVMGLAEVLPRLPRLIKRLKQTERAIRSLKPSALVTVDSPDFSFRLAKRLRGQGIPLIHFVAPTVWAWRPGRARKIAGFLDHLLALFPFEPPYFEREGLSCSFVGHSVVESGAAAGDGAAFRRQRNIAPDTPLVCVLPGSRHGETSRLLPVFEETLRKLAAVRPGLRAVVPLAPTVADEVLRTVENWPVPVETVTGEAAKFDAFAAADVALAASGTVSLELALAGLPTVIAYKTSPITAWLARRLVRVRFASLVNIVLEREAVPEFLQENCRADTIAEALEALLADDDARTAQISAVTGALEKLGAGGPSPSHRAAEAVLKTIRRGK
ncbi:MAG: lipid-A-disaccharide synthase [Rhodospirillales bacterium]|jgi:lipid-A-disaccharide synthase|nr:lipid-A-disaccharide synthase [Rhodospirillales bacterium]